MAKKTASGLVKYAKAQLGLPYWYGTFGQKSTSSLYYQKKSQYPNMYTANNFLNQLGVKVHDCIGLIKGYIWCENNSDSKPKYASNNCPDVNEEMMYNQASEKGDISTMPDIPGICVLFKGHIGVYIGGGEVIEARGHAYGVVKTKLNNRGWTKWCKCPYIEYDTKEVPTTNKNYVKVHTNGSVLNCRKKASILSKILGTFENGKRLEIINKKKKWYKVKGKATNGKTITGFCSKQWLKDI